MYSVKDGNRFRKMTPEQRFLSKFEKRENGCWIWIAGKDPGGYGVFMVNKKTVRGHVWSYEHFKGPRNGLFVLHRCDTPACVNPDHLELGDNSANMKDCLEKGRENFFGRHGARKTYVAPSRKNKATAS